MISPSHWFRALAGPLTPDRNPGIDLLRGIAIVLVVLLHLRIRIPVTDSFLGEVAPEWLLAALTDRGIEAVYLFFVISGFLITNHTLTRWGELHLMDARAFWTRRAARILPCLLLLVAVLALLHSWNVQGYVIRRPGQSLSGAVTAALGFHINWYEGQTGYLPPSWDVLWSLSIEEVFYLGFPVAALLIRSRIAMTISLAFLALALPILKGSTGGSEIWQQKAYLPGMSAIAAGAFAALIAPKAERLSGFGLQALYAIGVVGVVAAMLLADIPVRPRYGTLLLLTISAACLILAFHQHARLGTLKAPPGTAWLRSIGRLSYEIYLSHAFVVLLVAGWVRSLGWDGYWGFVWHAPALLIAWWLGWIVERLVSTPSMSLLLRRRPGRARRLAVPTTPGP